MSARLPALARGVRVRIASGIAMAGIGVAVACAAVAWRVAGAGAAALALCVVAAACAVRAWRRARGIDAAWVAATLDAQRSDLEDSTALLDRQPDSLGTLQRLQRERIVQRLRGRPPGDLRPRWPWRAITAAWLVATLALAWALAWPHAMTAPTRSHALQQTDEASPEPPQLVAATLRVTPPAYTGMDARATAELDAKAPIGSRLHWALRFAPQPAAVELATHDGKRIALRRDGDGWAGDARLDASMLYRIVVQGDAAQGRLHRIDAIPDQPPRVRVRIPERGLTLADPPPRAWTLSFEAEDDHGLASGARLLVTRTEGTGENIRFHEHVRTLHGRGGGRSLRFDASIDPSAFGLQRGEDLIARIEVRDNRAPDAQAARSAGVILRWPEEPVLGAEGLEGLARQVLPAYFRSQRQIIIDAEALLKDKPRLSQDAFDARSDAIGVDQRLLRLRYGQFLGEESEGGGAASLPTSDLPTGDGHGDEDGHADDEAPADPAHASHDHGVDASAEAIQGFGDPTGIVDAFGHTHDLPEAATLLDPKTKDILRKALREMWQSELHLRQAAPQQALPYAHRALEFIKQVQQADRIYLQRVGSRLPPIDETRRLGGKREGIAPRALPAAPSHAAEPLQQAWRALGERGIIAPATLDALQAWAGAHPARLDDPLALVAAIDALRLDPGCEACRDDLRGVLWAAMRRPDGGVVPRGDGDNAGKRYLRLLQREGGGE